VDATRGGNGRVLLAGNGSAVLALATVFRISTLHRPGGDICRITAFVVTAGARGQGIGRRLIEEIERYARDTGCARIEVTSAAPRLEAHAFYTRLGYTDAPKRFLKDLQP
jgi:GNAT superfamily N-acetyltransferase